jgi:plastocyanin
MRSIVFTCGAAALALIVSACGSSNGSNMGPTSPTPTPTSNSTINIVGNRGAQSFSPNPSPAPAAGQMVAWHNSDGATHRIVANDGSFDTGNIAPGAGSTPLQLKTDGANYHCSIHPSMIGAISASAGAPPPCTGQYCSSSGN